MTIETMQKRDFDQVLSELDRFWDERAAEVRSVHHPMFLYEFGDTAFVIREKDQVLAYLLGFGAHDTKTAYVHMIGVRKGQRKKGFAKELYRHFTEIMRLRGFAELKAITSPTNNDSISFHRSIGMNLLGIPNELGIPVVKDYRGPGEHRVIFHRMI